MDLDNVTPGGEACSGEVEAIDAERKILKNDVAVRGNLKTALEAVAFAEEFATGSEGRAFWIAELEMEFTAEALGARGDSGGEAEETGQQAEAGETDL